MGTEYTVALISAIIFALAEAAKRQFKFTISPKLLSTGIAAISAAVNAVVAAGGSESGKTVAGSAIMGAVIPAGIWAISKHWLPAVANKASQPITGAREDYFRKRNLVPIQSTWNNFMAKSVSSLFGDGPFYSEDGEAYGLLRDGTGMWAMIGKG